MYLCSARSKLDKEMERYTVLQQVYKELAFPESDNEEEIRDFTSL
jgi:hypothetical protein